MPTDEKPVQINISSVDKPIAEKAAQQKQVEQALEIPTSDEKTVPGAPIIPGSVRDQQQQAIETAVVVEQIQEQQAAQVQSAKETKLAGAIAAVTLEEAKAQKLGQPTGDTGIQEDAQKAVDMQKEQQAKEIQDLAEKSKQAAAEATQQAAQKVAEQEQKAQTTALQPAPQVTKVVEAKAEAQQKKDAVIQAQKALRTAEVTAGKALGEVNKIERALKTTPTAELKPLTEKVNDTKFKRDEADLAVNGLAEQALFDNTLYNDPAWQSQMNAADKHFQDMETLHEKAQNELQSALQKAASNDPHYLQAQKTLVAAQTDQAERTKALGAATTGAEVAAQKAEKLQTEVLSEINKQTETLDKLNAQFQGLKSGVKYAMDNGMQPDPKDVQSLNNTSKELESAATSLKNLVTQAQQQNIPVPQPQAAKVDKLQEQITQSKKEIADINSKQQVLFNQSPKDLQDIFNAAKEFDQKKAAIDKEIASSKQFSEGEAIKRASELAQSLATMQNAQRHYANSINPNEQQKSPLFHGSLASVQTREIEFAQIKDKLGVTDKFNNSAKIIPTDPTDKKALEFINQGNFAMQITKYQDGMRCDFQGDKNSIDQAMKAAAEKNQVKLGYDSATNNYYFDTDSEKFEQCMKDVKKNLEGTKNQKGEKCKVKEYETQDKSDEKSPDTQKEKEPEKEREKKEKEKEPEKEREKKEKERTKEKEEEEEKKKKDKSETSSKKKDSETEAPSSSSTPKMSP